MYTPFASIFTSLTPHGSAVEGIAFAVIALSMTIYVIAFFSLFLGQKGGKKTRAFLCLVFVMFVVSMVWASVSRDRDEAASIANTATTVHRTMRASVSAEQEIYRADGAYSESFSDLIAARPSLNVELIDHTLRSKSLVRGEEGGSVTIEYTFGHDETFDVVLKEGRVVLRGCKAPSNLGCEDGRWR